MDDFIYNGRGYGEVGEMMASREVGFDAGRLQPYLDESGVPCVTINTGHKKQNLQTGEWVPVKKQYSIESLARSGVYVPVPVGNALTVRKLDYVKMDAQLTEVARRKQVAAADLAKIGTIGGFNGMAKETYEYQAIADYGEAIDDMDGITVGRNDHPLIALSSHPLPITHVNLTRSQRRIEIWNNSNPTMQTLDLQQSGLRMGEKLEKKIIGTNSYVGIEFGTHTTSGSPTAQRSTAGASVSIASKEYGYTTHPARYTKTNLTTPTMTNSNTTFTEVLAMRQTLIDANFDGDMILYTSSEWDQWLDNNYGIYTGSSYGFTPSKTLRQMLQGINGITEVKRLPWLTSSTNPYTLILMLKSSEYFNLLNGMDLTTVQWPSKGGMQQNWKTMWIKTPLFKFDYNGYIPLVHATIS